jgi:hypothetical protein
MSKRAVALIMQLFLTAQVPASVAEEVTEIKQELARALNLVRQQDGSYKYIPDSGQQEK